jgi:hypothetical protein
MSLLIDGYNLLHVTGIVGRAGSGLQGSRNALLRFLAAAIEPDDLAETTIVFDATPEAQGEFAKANYEYPVNDSVEPTELLKSWGEFKEQDISLSALGDHNAKSILIFNEVGWK